MYQIHNEMFVVPVAKAATFEEAKWELLRTAWIEDLPVHTFVVQDPKGVRVQGRAFLLSKGPVDV